MTSCTKEVPVNYPVTPCHLPGVSQFPKLTVTEDNKFVYLPTSDVKQLYLWIKEINTRLNKAEICLANRS